MKLRTRNYALASMATEYPIELPGGANGVTKLSIRSRNGNLLRISGDEGGTDDGGDYYTLPGGVQNFDMGEVNGTIYVRSPEADSDDLEILYYIRGSGI